MPAPDQNELNSRIGPFATYIEEKRPDGVVARWESRRHRKQPQGAPAEGATWWAPRARGWWIAALFAVGSLLFAVGAVPGYASAVGARSDAITFFVGSLFFTAAGFLTYREAVDAGPVAPGANRRRFFVYQPQRIDWWATAVQLAGTLFFNISTGNTLRVDLRRRPPTSTCGGPTPSVRCASWWPAPWPGSRSATAGFPGAPGRGPGGSRCSTWLAPSPSACPPWPATSTRRPVSCTTPSGPTSAPSSAPCAFSPGPCCSCQNGPRNEVSRR